MKRMILILAVVLSCFSCDERRDVINTSQTTSESSVPNDQTLGSIVSIGLEELKSYSISGSQIHKGKLIYKSNLIFDCIEYSQKSSKKVVNSIKNNRNGEKKKHFFSLYLNAQNEFYIYCSFDENILENIFMFSLKNISDSSIILVPLHLETDSVVTPLSSFFYCDLKSKKLLCFAFQNFLNIQDGNYSISNLNTISFINSDMYEYYSMYYFYKKAIFSVESSYQNRNRFDKLFIQDTLIDLGAGKSISCVYQLSEDFPINSLLKQDHIKCGLPITEYPKLINRRIPAWCVSNRIY